MTEVTASLLYPAVYKFLLDANLKNTATALKQEANLIKLTPKSVIEDNLLEIYRTYLNNKTNGISKKRKREENESDEDEDTNKVKQKKQAVTQISSVKATPLNKSVPTLKKQIEKQDDSDDTDESDSDGDDSSDDDKGKKPETKVAPKVAPKVSAPKVTPKVTPKVSAPIKNSSTTKPTETSKIVPKSLPEVKKPQANDDEDDEEDEEDEDADEEDKTDKNAKTESKQNGNFKMNETSANNQNGKQNNKRKGNHSFQRINTNIDDLRPELRDNSFHAKDETYGAKANRDLSIVKGKGFRHEKTKKKRGTYKSGGHIDSGKVNSIKFE